MIQEEREERHKYKGVVKTVISAQSEDPMMAALKCVEGTCMHSGHPYTHTQACIIQYIDRVLLYNLTYIVHLLYKIGFVKKYVNIFIAIVFKSVAHL